MIKANTASAHDSRMALIGTATAAYVAAERDDTRRGTACRDLSQVLATYRADGLTVDQACDDISVAITESTDGRVKAPKAATIKAHAAAWAATCEHYSGRGVVQVAGAAYVARQSNRAGGSKAVAAILAGSKVAADVVRALDAMPRAEAKDAAPKADAPLKADAVLAYLERVAAQAWGDDSQTIARALLSAGKAVTGAKA